jgi:hypothetical protein
MENKDVCIFLRGEQESWDTSFLMTEEDALQIQNILNSNQPGLRLNLPSINGFGEIKAGSLELVYRPKANQQIISVPVAIALDLFNQAIDVAAENRRSNVAWELIWAWVNEQHESARVLTVAADERIDATLLKNEDEHVALQLSDGSIAITTVMNEDEIPLIGRKVILKLDQNGMPIISAQ